MRGRENVIESLLDQTVLIRRKKSDEPFVMPPRDPQHDLPEFEPLNNNYNDEIEENLSEELETPCILGLDPAEEQLQFVSSFANKKANRQLFFKGQFLEERLDPE